MLARQSRPLLCGSRGLPSLSRPSRLPVLHGTLRAASSRSDATEFAQLVTAMRAFHDRHQHFVVPYHFRIPSDHQLLDNGKTTQSTDDPWPSEVRGMALGTSIRRFVRAASNINRTKRPPARLADLKAVREQLTSIGFPQVTDWRAFQWEYVSLAALRTFQELEGHLMVPRSCVVPFDNHSWPRETWGFALGRHVNTLRSQRDTLLPYQVEDLNALEFVWDVAEHKWEKLFLPSLRQFYQLHGHTNVPQSFAVPTRVAGGSPDEWPQDLHGFRLGAMINHIRSSYSYQEFMERSHVELMQLQFSLNAHDTTWNEKILPCLGVFREVFGHCDIDVYFVVPHEDPWPEKAWGMRLGFIAQNIRGRGDYVDQVVRDSERLEELGFTWNVMEARWRRYILPSLATFVQVFDHTSIPSDFVVPAQEPWPELTWGFSLGAFASSSRQRLRFADFISIDNMRLEELGYAWLLSPAEESKLYHP